MEQSSRFVPFTPRLILCATILMYTHFVVRSTLIQVKQFASEFLTKMAAFLYLQSPTVERRNSTSPLADPGRGGGARDAPRSPSRSNFFDFHAVFEEILAK